MYLWTINPCYTEGISAAIYNAKSTSGEIDYRDKNPIFADSVNVERTPVIIKDDVSSRVYLIVA